MKAAEPVIRIIIVDEHEAIRSTWKVLLEKNPLFRIIAACSDIQTALEEARNGQPEIMLVDVKMKPVNGFILAERLLAALPGLRIIGMSVTDNPQYAERMLRHGARGFLTKTSPLEEIYRAISEVNRGEIYICEEIRSKMHPRG